MSDLVIILALIGLLFWQHWSYSRQVQALVDKVMSRNYAEYVQAQTPPPQHVERQVQFRPEEHLEDLGVLNGLQIR